jgi:hypothetical protein
MEITEDTFYNMAPGIMQVDNPPKAFHFSHAGMYGVKAILHLPRIRDYS